MEEDKTKIKIDQIRDSAGSFNLNSPDDDSEISGMLTIDERLLVIKGNGIYEIKLADQIDPKRLNENIPNTVQKLIPFGTNHPWVGKILLTAHRLFKSDILEDYINCDEILSRAFKIVEDIAALNELEKKFQEEQHLSIEGHDLRIKKDRSFILPAMNNVEVRCNEFLQKADHALIELFKIVKVFYSDVNKGGWDSLKTKIENGPKNIDNFHKFLTNAIPFLHLIRNARNCVEHPMEHQRLVVTNFSIDTNNNLLPPMIEIIHNKTPMKKGAILTFYKDAFSNLVEIIELMFVFLCARNIKAVSEGMLLV